MTPSDDDVDDDDVCYLIQIRTAHKTSPRSLRLEELGGNFSISIIHLLIHHPSFIFSSFLIPHSSSSSPLPWIPGEIASGLGGTGSGFQTWRNSGQAGQAGLACDVEGDQAERGRQLRNFSFLPLLHQHGWIGCIFMGSFHTLHFSAHLFFFLKIVFTCPWRQCQTCCYFLLLSMLHVPFNHA